MNDIDSIAQLSFISDADAARLVSGAARMDLAGQITSTLPAPGRPARARRAGSRTWRRRLLIGVPAAAVLAIAMLLVTSVGGPGHNIGQVTQAKAAALVFTRHGRYIDVIVRNPLADPKKYRAEFKAHGLNVTLRLVPVSPSIVGTVVYFDGSPAIKTITAQGKCFTGGGGPACPVGLRIPVHYKGRADLVFGRAARPGEHYESTVAATTKGEALYGLRIQGRHVSAVLRMIAARHVTVAVFNVTTPQGIGKLEPASKIPGRWWVYGADPWAAGQVMLFVGPLRHQPQAGPPSPATPAPSPTPTPSQG